MIHQLAPLAAVLSVSLATAQGTITDQNVRYAWPTIPATLNTSIVPTFTANVPLDPNLFFEEWWAYRVAGDTNELYFNNATLTQSASGSHGDLDWTDVGNRGLLSASLDLDVLSTGATSGMLIASMTLRNISAGPLTVNLFHFLDIDGCTTGGHSATGAGVTHVVSTACATGGKVDVNCTGADRWAVLPWVAANECGIQAAGTVTLPNAALPFGPADYMSAVQWEDRVLQPAGTLNAVMILHHNPPICGVGSQSTSYGVGAMGSNGQTPTLTCPPLAVGGSATMTWANTLPGAAGALFVGAGQLSLPFQNITLLVNVAFTGNITSNPSGGGTLPLSLSATPSLCGQALDFQAFFIDGGRAPLALSHTAGLELTFGY